MRNLAISAFVLCLLFPIAGTAEIVNVPGDQSTIQAGIDAAAEWDTVVVDDGIYSGDGNRDIDFGGKNVYLLSVNGAESTIIDCGGTVRPNLIGRST